MNILFRRLEATLINLLFSKLICSMLVPVISFILPIFFYKKTFTLSYEFLSYGIYYLINPLYLIKIVDINYSNINEIFEFYVFIIILLIVDIIIYGVLNFGYKIKKLNILNNYFEKPFKIRLFFWSLLRTLSMYLFFIPYITLLSTKKQTLYDLICGILVIDNTDFKNLHL